MVGNHLQAPPSLSLPCPPSHRLTLPLFDGTLLSTVGPLGSLFALMKLFGGAPYAPLSALLSTSHVWRTSTGACPGSTLCPQNVSFDISTLTGTAILLSDSLAAGMYPMSSSAAACLLDPSVVSLSSHPRLLAPCRMPPLCPLLCVHLLTLSPAISTRCYRVSMCGHQPALCPAAHVESPWVSGGAGG